jgi:RIO-like serine/threonine protein kinase
MLRIHNIGGISAAAVRGLCAMLDEDPGKACAANIRKSQYIYQTEADGVPLFVKVYFHRTLPHRFAAWLNHANADRYADSCLHLATRGIIVPRPVLIARRGAGPLPDRTLLAMTGVEGAMLLDSLPAIENDPARIARLADGIADLFRRLGEAGVIHRDFNTKNILLSNDGHLALIDFDFARRYRSRGAAFRRKHRREIHSFVASCRLSPGLAAAVISRLETESATADETTC